MSSKIEMRNITKHDPENLGHDRRGRTAHRINIVRQVFASFFFAGDDKTESEHSRLRTERSNCIGVRCSTNANINEAVGSFANIEVSHFDAVRLGDAICFGSNASNETLGTKQPIGFGVSGRQANLMIDPGFMFGRRADLENFGTGRGLEHSISDLGRLKNAIAGFKPKRLALVFVNDANASTKTIDQLKPYFVIMHIVGHLAALDYPNMRGNKLTAETVRKNVAIHHSCTAGRPAFLFSKFTGRLRRRIAV